jgi:GTPase SAR1 family protein
MGTEPSAAEADAKKGQAEPAAEHDKQRGTKRHQDKQTDEQHDTDAHAASKKPRRGAAAAIIVYDITSTDSLNRAKAWVRELQRQGSPNMIMALAGG